MHVRRRNGSVNEHILSRLWFVGAATSFRIMTPASPLPKDRVQSWARAGMSAENWDLKTESPRATPHSGKGGRQKAEIGGRMGKAEMLKAESGKLGQG
jgi:hypothetical protein